MRPDRRQARSPLALRSRLAAVVVVVVVGASLVLAPAVGGADELSDKKAQAQEAEAKLNSLDTRLQRLSADAEVVKGELAKAEAAVADAQARADAAHAELVALQAQLKAFAVDAYVAGGGQPGADAIFSSDGDKAPAIQGYIKATTTSRQDLIDSLGAVRQRAEEEGRELSQAQQELADRKAQLESSLDEAASAVAEQEAIKARLDGEVSRLVEEARQAAEAQRAREAAAAQAAQQAREARSTPTPSRTSTPSAPSSPSVDLGPPPPVGQGAAAAVAAAQSRLGARYVWAGSGPNVFDCSGLTMWAWAQAGRSLSHYTGSQLQETRRISASDAQPGDLVFFWGPGDGGDPTHVGLYVGGGQMIHAPGTGRNVKYDSVNYWTGARVAYGRV